MLKNYARIIEEYKTWHPTLYAKTVECKPSGKYRILATLRDDARIEFNSLDKSIRDVTKFYMSGHSAEIDETAWRKEFGQRLSRAIIDKSMTQEKLSEVTGISRQMLSRYVRGTSTPSGYILSRLVEALGCDVRELTRFGYIDEE